MRELETEQAEMMLKADAIQFESIGSAENIYFTTKSDQQFLVKDPTFYKNMLKTHAPEIFKNRFPNDKDYWKDSLKKVEDLNVL